MRNGAGRMEGGRGGRVESGPVRKRDLRLVAAVVVQRQPVGQTNGICRAFNRSWDLVASLTQR